jgi:hypothetical protein
VFAYGDDNGKIWIRLRVEGTGGLIGDAWLDAKFQNRKELNERTVRQTGKAPSSFELSQAQTEGCKTSDSLTNNALPNAQGGLI